MKSSHEDSSRTSRDGHSSGVVGHGIAAEPIENDGRVIAVRTMWLPTATVPRVKTRDDIQDVLVGMEDLAALLPLDSRQLLKPC